MDRVCVFDKRLKLETSFPQPSSSTKNLGGSHFPCGICRHLRTAKESPVIRKKQGSRNQTRLGTAELKGTLGPRGKIKVISADNPSIVGDYALILF